MQEARKQVPVRALVWIAVPFLALLAALNLIPRDPLAGLPAIGLPAEAVGSLWFPTPFLEVTDGAVRPIRRQDGEVRVFFVGASETYALPYQPPGFASYAFQLGAGLQAVTGRTDIHVRAEGNPALDSPQIVAQAKKILEYGDPSLIVLVVGANEYLNRIVRGKALLPEGACERIGQWAGAGRALFDAVEEWLRRGETFARWMRQPADQAVDSFLQLTRKAEPGRPAVAGLPVRTRDRRLLMDRLRQQIRELATACRDRGCQLAIALSLHEMDGAPPWCSQLEPGDVEIRELCERVFRQPSESQLPEVERWLRREPRADLIHARAKIWRALGRGEAARAEFLRALDFDLVPMHQTSEVRATLGEEAGRLGLRFLDLNDAFADRDGITGPDNFLDYAHADLEGHQKLALWLARELQGELLPALPEGFAAKFRGGMQEWSGQITAESIRLARAEMSFTLGRYYMAFGNFRAALPHCRRAAEELTTAGTGPQEDLAFCREKLGR